MTVHDRRIARRIWGALLLYAVTTLARIIREERNVQLSILGSGL